MLPARDSNPPRRPVVPPCSAIPPAAPTLARTAPLHMHVGDGPSLGWWPPGVPQPACASARACPGGQPPQRRSGLVQTRRRDDCFDRRLPQARVDRRPPAPRPGASARPTATRSRCRRRPAARVPLRRAGATLSMCCWLDWHAEAQGRLSPIDATLLEDVMSFSYLIYQSTIHKWRPLHLSCTHPNFGAF